MLTVEGYQATGGIRGAVARSAERLYETMPPEDSRRRCAPCCCGSWPWRPSGEPVRSRALGPESWPAIRPGTGSSISSSEARLVTTDEDSVELAHEALARAWPRLRGWLDESRTELRLAAQLREAARSWDEFGRDEASLYRGARMVAALEAGDDRDDIALDPTEREFLDASPGPRGGRAHRGSGSASPRAKNVHRLRGLVAGVAVLAVVATGTALVAVDQAAAPSRRGGSRPPESWRRRRRRTSTSDPERSILLALEAVELTRAERRLRSARSRTGAAPRRDGVSPRAERARPGRQPGLEPGRLDLRDRGTGGTADAWTSATRTPASP